MPPNASTLANLTDRLTSAARPLVTYYDLGTGERTELSGTTMANWVAKISNFLTDELDVAPGVRLRLGLGSHWLRFAWLLSAWNVGAALVTESADIALTGPDLDASEPVRIASALLPFGARFDRPPQGFIDMGVEVASQPDDFVSLDPPTADTIATDFGAPATHREVLDHTTGEPRRLLLPTESGTGDHTAILQRDAWAIVAACLGGGSLVIARGTSERDRSRLAQQEGAQPS